MYKVLIVDDEAIIVEGLTRTIQWDRYSCQVVGTACSGANGVEAIRKYEPDILFTDIRMPGEDGLSMISDIRTDFPDLQITVLTGYRDFSYAQAAINLGVTRFLLKPSKMDELEEALSAMISNLKRIGINEDEELPEKSEDGSANTDAASSFIVRQAVSYIESQCHEKISLADVAEKCYVSTWHLSKLLHKYTNQNFYEILNGARIARAKKLLMNPALRISEIAEQVGYIDVAHFSRVFKKSEGVSANEYRNLNK